MDLRKSILAAGVAAVAVASVAGTAMARDLTVVSWGGAYQAAQKEVFFEPFAKQTGIPMIDESWDGGVGVLRAQVEGGAATWDVVQVESEELALGCEEGLFEVLDWDRIGDKNDFLAETVSECGVGAIIYNFVIGFDRDRLNTAPTSWADFFDTAKFPGKRALRNGPKTTLEAALMADGVAPRDVYAVLSTDEGVERAFAKLETIRDDLIFWRSGAQPPQLLASGEVVMSSIYNGRIDAANKDGQNFGTVWDGSLFTIDSWVVLAGSPNMDDAYKFLAFASEAEHQAKLPMTIAYGVPHKDAKDSIPADRLKDLPTAPENMANAIQISDEFWLENIDRLTQRFNTWAAR